MKVKISIFLAAVALAFVMPSCSKLNKDANEIKETISMTDSILPTETFTYLLPENKSDDPYQITTQAKHFSKSELSTDASGRTVYTYAYSGVGEQLLTDDVVIANVEETHNAGSHSGHPGTHHKHNCDSAKTEIERTINIHFIIK